MPTTSGIIAMRAQVSAIGMLKPIGGLFGWLAMQLRVDPLRQLTRNPFDGCYVVDRCSGQAAHAAEAGEQLLASFGSDAFHAFQLRCVARSGPSRPHSRDREAMRFVTDLRDQHQRL